MVELWQLHAGGCWCYLQLASIPFEAKGVVQSKNILYVPKYESFHCYYPEKDKTQQQDRRPSEEIAVTCKSAQKVNDDKLLSTVPAVKWGCSIYHLLKLGFVGFGLCWQPIVCTICRSPERVENLV